MRKFKLLFVVMASIFFLPTQMFAQSETDRMLENVYQMKLQNDDVIRQKEKEYGANPTTQQKEDLHYLKLQFDSDLKSVCQELLKKGLTKEQIESYFAKRQKEDVEREKSALSDPTELGNRIIAIIEKKDATFSEEENLTNSLLSLEKSDERKEALLKVYNFLDVVANKYYDAADNMMGRPGHKGTERGEKELVLAERIKKQMNEEGYKTFGFLPGQREDDIIVRVGGAIGTGSKIQRKNGVLVFDKDGRTFTMNDGTVFRGYFKEELTLYGESGESYEVVGNDQKLLLADELTPYHGAITYADGTTDGIKAGKSVNAHNKAVKAAIDAELKAAKSEYTKLCQKYGAATINSLKTTGSLKVGYSVTMLNDYIAVYNKYMTARVKAENGRHDPLGLRYYEPTVNEVLKYGKTAKRVKLGGTMFANELVLANCMVANGKIAAIYQNTTILAMKDL